MKKLSGLILSVVMLISSFGHLGVYAENENLKTFNELLKDYYQEKNTNIYNFIADKLMTSNNLGEVSRELYAQFLYRINLEFKNRQTWIGMFSTLKYIISTNVYRSCHSHIYIRAYTITFSLITQLIPYWNEQDSQFRPAG